MPNEWKVIEMNLTRDSEKKRKHNFYENGIDFIECSFSEWLPEKNTPTEVTIHSIYKDTKRRFFKANYCVDHDRIEIHYESSSDFKKKTLEIEGYEKCIIKCTKVRFISYETSASANNPVLCKNVPATEPKHRKGSIIVGQP